MREKVTCRTVIGWAALAACKLLSNAVAESPATQTPSASAPKREADAGIVYAVTHVNVIPMTLTGEPLLNASVVVADGRIASINGSVPQGAKAIDGMVWGFSLHDELGLLVDAGLSTGEALSSATRLPAIWLGMDKVVGSIEVGKYADLAMLDANPLDDIGNTRKIFGVFVNGRWIDRVEIGEMLSGLARRNALSKDKFDWSRRGDL